MEMPSRQTIVNSRCCSPAPVFLKLIAWPELLELTCCSHDKELHELALTNGDGWHELPKQKLPVGSPHCLHALISISWPGLPITAMFSQLWTCIPQLFSCSVCMYTTCVHMGRMLHTEMHLQSENKRIPVHMLLSSQPYYPAKRELNVSA